LHDGLHLAVCIGFVCCGSNVSCMMQRVI
jgi:hypothetical protein